MIERVDGVAIDSLCARNALRRTSVCTACAARLHDATNKQ